MKLFRRLLLQEFLPFLILSVLFFALILVMADLFTNLWRYLNHEVPFSQALVVSLLYAPRAVAWALPIGAMFAAAFGLGNLASRNELISVFGAGVPLFRFVLPILLWAVFLSASGFVIEDQLAIPMMKQRNALSDELLGVQDSLNRSRAVAIAESGRIVYYADYYNDEGLTLTGTTVIQLDEENRFMRRIDADRAVWDGEAWVFESCRIFTEVNGDVLQERVDEYRDSFFSEPPDTFRLDSRDIEEMTSDEALNWIATQRRAGLPYKALQAEFYQRYTMALTPFLVVLFAGAIGGRFKRNVLLLSLLASLALAVAWYVVRMISTLLSSLGLVPPLLGAVVPFMTFLALGAWLFKHART